MDRRGQEEPSLANFTKACRFLSKLYAAKRYTLVFLATRAAMAPSILVLRNLLLSRQVAFKLRLISAFCSFGSVENTMRPTFGVGDKSISGVHMHVGT